MATSGYLFRVTCELINSSPSSDTALGELKHRLFVVIHLFARWGKD